MDQLAGRLLAICNVAANVQFSGQFEESTPYFERANFLETPTAIVAGVGNINAALVGRIAVPSNYHDVPPVNTTIFCYRATVSPDDATRPDGQRLCDWAQNFEALLVRWVKGTGLCHQGFANALNTLANAPLDAWPQIPADGPVIFCGHSKGGGLAQLAALVYWLQHRRPVQCVTFGSPRAGGSEFAKAIADSGVTIHRHEHAADVVCHVPFEPRVAELLARIFQIDELKTADYRSAGSLRYIDSDGSILAPSNLPDELRTEAKAILALTVAATTGGFEAIRRAHAIGIGSGYWSALNPALTTSES